MTREKRRQINKPAVAAMSAAINAFAQHLPAGPPKPTARQLSREDKEWAVYVEELVSMLEDTVPI